MKDKMYFFTLGFMLMGLIAMIVVSISPTPEGDVTCGKCGSFEWYFKVASND
jgi:hypothetical protein